MVVERKVALDDPRLRIFRRNRERLLHVAVRGFRVVAGGGQPGQSHQRACFLGIEFQCRLVRLPRLIGLFEAEVRIAFEHGNLRLVLGRGGLGGGQSLQRLVVLTAGHQRPAPRHRQTLRRHAVLLGLVEIAESGPRIAHHQRCLAEQQPRAAVLFVPLQDLLRFDVGRAVLTIRKVAAAPVDAAASSGEAAAGQQQDDAHQRKCLAGGPHVRLDRVHRSHPRSPAEGARVSLHRKAFSSRACPEDHRASAG